MKRGRTLIVTGAAGFIGSHLAAALIEQGARVVGVDNFDPFYDRRAKLNNLAALDPERFTLVEGDVRDVDLTRRIVRRARPDGVFHLAALAGVRPSIENPRRYVSVNVDGLVSVLDAAREAGCERFVFASSSSVYGNNRKTPFAENDPVDEPISPYAATKRAGELLCETYSRLFDMSIVSLRFFTVYGPAQRPDLAISRFMRAIALGEEVTMFGDGSTSRDYTYIDDIVAGVLAAWEETSKHRDVGTSKSSADNGHALRTGGGFHRIYNLGGSNPIRLSDMIGMIAEVVGREPRVRRLPMQPGDVERTFADLARSNRELRYEPQTSFIEGLRRQWEWMRSRLPAAERSGVV